MASTVKIILDTPELLSAQYDWANHPMTKMMITCVREKFGAKGLPATGHAAETALYYSGGIDTTEGIIRFFENFNELAEVPKAVAALNKIKATYGAGSILAEDGYIDPENKETSHE